MFDPASLVALSPEAESESEADGLGEVGTSVPVTTFSAPLEQPAWDTHPWFHGLAPVRKRSLKGAYLRPRSSTYGRTMPLDEAMNLRDVDVVRIEGAPSISVFLGASENATITVERHSKYWKYFAPEDMAAIRALSEEMLAAFRHYSNGPLSLRMLREMGHPYGYGPGKDSSGRKSRRKVPRINHIKGVRGAVANYSVINRQSGNLMAAWNQDVTTSDDGFVMNFWNTAKSRKGAPYPWYLIAGTGRMQAHSPANVIPVKYLPRIDSLHRKAIAAARQRALADANAESMALGDFNGNV